MTHTSFSRERPPRRTLTADGLTSNALATKRQSRSFARPSTGGAAMRTRNRPASPHDAVGLGQDLVIGDGVVAGHALEWDGTIVHLAAFATGNGDDEHRESPSQRIDRSRWVR